mmetsp:Transcript_131085/g.184827  ORF Transcript_131085/g.184827 Transcript_131085/m.184827 type:complete len:214 (-) Transcript_131085:1373-2014(-)
MEGQVLWGWCCTPTFTTGHHLVARDAFKSEMEQHRSQEGLGFEESKLTSDASTSGEAPRMIGIGMSLPHRLWRKAIWIEAQGVSKLTTPVLWVRMQATGHQVDPLTLVDPMASQQCIIGHVTSDGRHRAVKPQSLAKTLLYKLQLGHVVHRRLGTALQHLPDLLQSSFFVDGIFSQKLQCESKGSCSGLVPGNHQVHDMSIESAEPNMFAICT